MTRHDDAAGKRIVLLLGDASRDEMSPLVEWIHGRVEPDARLVRCVNIESLLSNNPPFGPPLDEKDFADEPASRRIGRDEFPDLIIVLQSWPDEYSSQDVGWLLRHSPLARIVVCMGSWCESIGRNRDNWPIAVRIPLWAAMARIEREWNLMERPGSPNPPPWSASREELFAFDQTWDRGQFKKARVSIDSPDASYKQFLNEQLVARGATIVTDCPRVCVIDVDPWNPSRAEWLKRYRDENPDVTVLALTNQIDRSVVSALGEIGVTHVSQKLAPLTFPMDAELSRDHAE